MCVEHSVAALQVYLYACSGVRSKQGREEQRRVQSVYSVHQYTKQHLPHWLVHLPGCENVPTQLSATCSTSDEPRQPTSGPNSRIQAAL